MLQLQVSSLPIFQSANSAQPQFFCDDFSACAARSPASCFFSLRFMQRP